MSWWFRRFTKTVERDYAAEQQTADATYEADTRVYVQRADRFHEQFLRDKIARLSVAVGELVHQLEIAGHVPRVSNAALAVGIAREIVSITDPCTNELVLRSAASPTHTETK